MVPTRAQFDGILFDLDGVLTRTPPLHALSWKRVFDDFFAAHDSWRAAPFQLRRDYLRLCDGRSRYEAAANVLRSRGIELAWGDPADPPDRVTVCGLANRKNLIFKGCIAKGVRTYPDSIAYLCAAHRAGFALGLVSGSRNAKTVLAAAGLERFFAVQVDGCDSDRLGLRGKPRPDSFLAAARRLGTTPGRTTVLEDSVAGIRAALAGHFGLVIGIARFERSTRLLAEGAHLVVGNLRDPAIMAHPV